MRRAILLALIALVMGALPVGATLPGANAGADQVAEAFWIHPTNGTFYFAGGFQLVSPDLTVRLVAIGKGRCTHHRIGRHVSLMMCTARGPMREATVEEFFMDPALRSASIDIEMAGERHVVDWVSDSVPELNWNAGAGGWGTQADLSIGARASAEGTLFGEKVDADSFKDMAGLSEGGGYLVYSFHPLRDGTFVAKVSFRD